MGQMRSRADRHGPMPIGAAGEDDENMIWSRKDEGPAQYELESVEVDLIPDKDITLMDTPSTPPSKIQVHARQLNLRVSLFLMIPLCDFENRLLPNELIVVRNHGDDDEIAGEVIGDVMGQQGRPSQGGGPIKTDFESVSEPSINLY